jgi:hypothetical protein
MASSAAAAPRARSRCSAAVAPAGCDRDCVGMMLSLTQGLNIRYAA